MKNNGRKRRKGVRGDFLMEIGDERKGKDVDGSEMGYSQDRS